MVNPNQKIDRDENIKRMFKLMLESMMEGERTDFLGYAKHCFEGYGTDNSRNGFYERDLLTGMGNLENLKIPRDRLGDFSPELIDKWERSARPMDLLILKLYAKGMSTRDINDVIREIYGKDLSPQAVTNITQEIEVERTAWEKRPLKKKYIAVFIDALFAKIRRDTVAADAVYTAAAIDENGNRDILGQYVGTSESATFWKETVLADLKQRGVEEVLIFIFDGLTGLVPAVNEIFPKTLTQLCIIHQVRSTLSNVRQNHKQAIADDLKTVYKSKSKSEAKDKILSLKIKWRTEYPRLFNSWIDKIELLMNFLEFPEYLRPHLYSTNWIERLNKEFRKLLKTKNSMPTENSVRNLLYFKIKDMSKKWDTQRLNGFVAYQADINILWEKFYGGKEGLYTM